MTAELILDRLEGVKRTGADRWMARCPAHQDKRPSLGIKETADGVVLIKCWSGCTVHEITHAVGLEMTDLFPPRPDTQCKGQKRPFPTAEIFRALADEMMVVALSSADLIKGKSLTEQNHNRLVQAVGRINAALQEGGIR